jgi:Protein of unknown function (DUF1348)/Domain of unknown function (DUF4145)
LIRDGGIRSEFINGRNEIIAFLSRKWAKELDYRLIKELWAFTGNRIAVRFAYGWHDDSGHWYRSYGRQKLKLKLNDAIALLVRNGLDARVQKALDVVRVIGNDALHPGQIDVDDRSTAETLFGLVSLICEKMIIEPKHVEEVYATCLRPLGKR